METEHFKTFEKLANKIGVDVIKKTILKAIPHSRILEANKSGDEHLNSIPLENWDALAMGIKVSDVRKYNTPQGYIAVQGSIFFKMGLSLSERVCVLKHVARHHIKDQKDLEAVASLTQCALDEIKRENYDHYGLSVFSIGNEQYAVAESDQEADKACSYTIKDSLWAFNATFLAEKTKLPKEVFEALQHKCEDSNETILTLVEKTCGLKSFVYSAIGADGRGHFLSGYDGKEKEVKLSPQETFYVYRLN